MYSSFSTLFFRLHTFKSKNRRCQKRAGKPSPFSNFNSSCPARTFLLRRSRRETRCFKTCITVEGVPRAGSPINK